MSSKWILRIACLLQIASIGILYTFEAVRMKDLGIGETTIGLILAISNGGFILSSIFWGRLADDKHWYKLIAVWGSLTFSALLIYFSVCSSVWQFLVYAIVKGIVAPMVIGVMPALAVGALGAKRRGRDFGVYRSFGSLGFLLGSITLPIIFDDIAIIARGGSVLILFAFILLWRLPEPKLKHVPEVPLRIPELNSIIKLFLISLFFVSLADPAVQGFFSAYGRHLGASTRLIGLLSGFMAVTALIFLPLMGKWSDRVNPSFIISIAFLAQPLRVYITSLIGQAELLWIPLLFHGVCWGGTEVAAIVFLSSLAKDGQKATVLSFYMATRMLGHLVGSGLTGYLAETYGYVPMFHLMAAVALFGASIYIAGNYLLKTGEGRHD